MSTREKVQIILVWVACVLFGPWVLMLLGKYVFWAADVVFRGQG